MIMFKRSFVVASFFLFFGSVCQLHAAPVANTGSPESPQNNGRYLLHQGTVQGNAANVTLMIDSQLGRVWLLQPDKVYGSSWLRIPIVELKQVQDGFLLRPMSPQPFAGAVPAPTAPTDTTAPTAPTGPKFEKRTKP